MATAERRRLLPRVAGVVLEIGVGSGLNVPYFSSSVERLVGLDPSVELWRMASERVAGALFPIRFVRATAEQISFAPATFDWVVTTWSLCSIPRPLDALGEVRRILKPGGRLAFIEHGRAPDRSVVAWQDRLTPIWRHIGGGCHLNRPIDELLRTAGFAVDDLETGYTKGPRPFTYLYRGIARTATG